MFFENHGNGINKYQANKNTYYHIMSKSIKALVKIFNNVLTLTVISLIFKIIKLNYKI